MKRLLLGILISLMVSITQVEAAFVSGSSCVNLQDPTCLGAFSPTANTVLTVPAGGIFNFTTINIPAGVTVTFTNNTVNTPVIMLATGDVTIAGTLKVDGGNAVTITPGQGGPGGFAGGFGGASTSAGGQGLGPGGGKGGPYSGNAAFANGGAGSYGTAGGGNQNGIIAPTYGNDTISPLIGGSGGGGQGGINSPGAAGGGGGGAILIASSTTITISGAITANGGSGTTVYGSGGGSGGAIRLIANTISGGGTVSAKGGTNSTTASGGEGRIRFEAYTVSWTSGTDPAYTYGQPGSVFVPNTPTLSITSIAGVSVPSNPAGSYSQPDLLLPNTTTNPVAVAISATNIPVGTTVTVSVIPPTGSVTNATAALSGSQSSSTATANVNISSGIISVLMVQATFTVQTAMYWEGEKIEKALVRAIPGRKSETIYITESGKQINANLIAKTMN